MLILSLREGYAKFRIIKKYHYLKTTTLLTHIAGLLLAVLIRIVLQLGKGQQASITGMEKKNSGKEIYKESLMIEHENKSALVLS